MDGDHGSPTLIEVAALTKRYGEQFALTDVTFDVRAGEVLGIIGPNGAGKTTLLESIAGLLLADSGDVLWQGRPLPLARRRNKIFYLPDGLRPYQDQYVARVLSFFAGVYRRPRAQLAHTVEQLGLGSVLQKRVQALSKGYARRLVLALGLRPYQDQYVARVLSFFAGVYRRPRAQLAHTVEQLGLGSVLQKRVQALSKGYARRLVLALGLLAPQPLLIMDEPFDGFDLKQTRDVVQMLRELAGNGRALVLAIHQLADAERVCDRFLLLAEGRVQARGTLDDLRIRTTRPAANLEDIFLALT